jgi:hypothetical protein
MRYVFANHYFSISSTLHMHLARDVYEDSVYLSIGLEDKEVLEKRLQSLGPYYTPSSGIRESQNTPLIRYVCMNIICFFLCLNSLPRPSYLYDSFWAFFEPFFKKATSPNKRDMKCFYIVFLGS